MKSVLNILGYFLEQFLEACSLLKICKIVLEYILKCSQLISSCWQPEMLGWIQAAMQKKYYFLVN